MNKAIRKRILAWGLAIIMVLTSVSMPQGAPKAKAAESEVNYEAINIASSSLNGNAIRGSSESASDAAMDNYAYFYSEAVNASGGLPTDGQLTMPVSKVPYYLAAGEDTSNAYDGNDCIRLTADYTSQTMDLETIGVYNQIYVLATAGGPGTGHYADFKVTLTYTDGTTGSTTYKLYDWYDLTTVDGVEKYYNICRMNNGTSTVTGTTGTSDGPVLHSAAIDVDASKLLKSITFTMNGKDGNASNMRGLYCCVFAITGATPGGVLDAPVATSATKVVGDTSGAFTANWNAVEGAESYTIDIATNRNFTNILSSFNNKNVGNVTSYKVSDSSIKDGVTYYYRVRAVNDKGQSLSSNRIATNIPNWIAAAIEENDLEDSILYDVETNTLTFLKDVTLKDTLVLPDNDTTTIKLTETTVTAPEGKTAISAGDGSNVQLSVRTEGEQGSIVSNGTTSDGEIASVIDFSEAKGLSKIMVANTKVTGGDGATNTDGTAGSGGPAITANVSVRTEVKSNSEIRGGNGGDTESGKAGNGAIGIIGGEVIVSKDAIVTGGNGGNAISGIGGSGAKAAQADTVINNNGTVIGGDGGNGRTIGIGADSGVTSGTNGKSGKDGVAHIHEWKYKKQSDDTMIATCGGGMNYDLCEIQEDNPVTLTVKANTAGYTGEPYNAEGEDIDCNERIVELLGAETTITYYKKPSEDSTDSLGEPLKSAPIARGDYIAVFTFTNGKAEGSPVVLRSSFSIVKGTPRVSVRAVNYLTYTGLSQRLVEGSTGDGTVYYRLGEDGEWSTDIPTAVNASEEDSPYVVYYYVIGDDNHNDLGSAEEPAGSVNAKIGKAWMPYGDITALSKTVTYDQKPHTIDAVTGKNSAAGAKVTYSVSEDGPYTKEIPEFTNAGRHVIYYQVSKDNYSDKQGSVFLTIEPKKVNVVWGETNLIYNGAEQAPTATAEGVFDGDEFSVSVEGKETDTNEVSGKSVYTARAIGSDNANYEISSDSATCQYTIGNADQTMPQLTTKDESISGKNDGKIEGLTTDMEYRQVPETESGDITEEYTKVSDADMTFAPGTYEVRLAKRPNYNVSNSVRVTIGAGHTISIKLPTIQDGYTMTSDVSETKWQGEAVLTLTVKEGYTKTDAFAVKANADVVDNEDGTFSLKNIQEDVVVEVIGIKDITAPIGEISISGNIWNTLLDEITFDLLYKEKKEVTITAEDAASGVKSIEYLLSDQVLAKGQLSTMEAARWTRYNAAFELIPDCKTIVYVKITDKAGNITYLSSNGLIFDNAAPVIAGVKDGEELYTENVYPIKIEDVSLEQVYVTDGTDEYTETDSVEVKEGTFTLVCDAEKTQKIIAVDKFGNRTAVTVSFVSLTKIKDRAKEELNVKKEDILSKLQKLSDLAQEEKEAAKEQIELIVAQTEMTIHKAANRSWIEENKAKAETAMDAILKTARDKELVTVKEIANNEIKQKAEKAKKAIDKLQNLSDEQKQSAKDAIDKQAEEVKKSLEAVTEKDEVKAAQTSTVKSFTEKVTETKVEDYKKAKEDKPTGDLPVTIPKDSENPEKEYRVGLNIGNTEVEKTDHVKAGEEIVFDQLPDGTYNLVISDSDNQRTVMAIVSNGQGTIVGDAAVSEKNTTVEIKENAPDVAVGGLDKIYNTEVFTKNDKATETISSGEGKVDIRFFAQNSPSDADFADQLDTEKTIDEYVDYQIQMIVTDRASKVEKYEIKDTKEMILIAKPLTQAEKNRSGYVLLRKHNDGAADKIEKLPMLAGEEKVSPKKEGFYIDNDYLYIWARKFSVYALSYNKDSKPQPTVTPTSQPTATPTLQPTATPAVQPTKVPQSTAQPTGELPVIPETSVSSKEQGENALALNAKLKVSQKGKKIRISWGKVEGASGYDVYVQYCGKKFTKQSLYPVTDGNTTKLKIQKVNGKKLNLKKNYKIYVVAYKMTDGQKVILGKTITAHIVGRKNAKNSNVKAIKLTKKAIQLQVGKRAKIKAKTVLVDKTKKPLSNAHAKELRFASSDRSIVGVTKTGRLKARRKGKCVVYVYARNGYAKKVLVKVK